METQRGSVTGSASCKAGASMSFWTHDAVQHVGSYSVPFHEWTALKAILLFM